MTPIISKVLVVAFLPIVYFLVRTLVLAYKPGLRSIPGPFLSKFSAIPRLALVSTGKAHERYRSLHDRYGPIVRTSPNAIDVSDPSMIPIIYGINTKYLKNEFYCTMSVLYKNKPIDSMFSTKDPVVHRNLKRSVTSKYSLSSLKSLETLVDQCSAIFIDSMLDLAGQRVDLGEWLQWYAFDVIGMITFSKRFGFMEKRTDISNAIQGLDFALAYGAVIGQVPWMHRWLLGSPAFVKFMKWISPNLTDPRVLIEGMTMDAIKASDEQKASQPEGDTEDFLTYLRRAEVKNGARMPEEELANHLMNNLFAGSDTTAISLRAIFYYLIKNPIAYARIQQELDAADAAGKLSEFITYEESLQLKYLHCCVKEATRLHPGVAMPLERFVPPEGAQICGRFIPGGTTIGMNPAVVNRDRGVFGNDADEFRPERWMEKTDGGEGNSKEKLAEMEKTLLTFGAGARYCIGKNISLLEMGKFVPQVLRRFDLQWASDKEEWQIETFWFSRQRGLLVKFVPRDRD